MLKPLMILGSIFTKDSFSDGGEILAGMIPVHDLDCVWKIVLDQFPDPDGSITNEDQFLIQVSLALASRSPEQLTELVRCLDVTVIADILGLQIILLPY